MLRIAGVMLAAVGLVAAKEKGPPVAQAATDKMAVRATLYLGKDAIREQVGSDLGGYFLLVRVEITPKGDKPLAISRDDFLLRSYNDGQKCQPYAPSQIAGGAALVISTASSGGGIMSNDRGPVWGGIGGRPRRLPDDSPEIGNAGSESTTQATVQKTGGKENPLLATLEEKVLHEKKTSEPVSGLLYFSLDGKHKAKNLELQYDGPGGKLALDFK